MKLSQLSLADYNLLDNIPVINQDLSATGFTPIANTYYRHTGATTDTFTQGVIYLYDTGYHKLGESGGTTWNKYTFTVATKPSVAQASKILNVLNSAKRILEVRVQDKDGNHAFMAEQLGKSVYTGKYINAYSDVYIVYSVTLRDDLGSSGIAVRKTSFQNGAFSTSEIAMTSFVITYLNDIEIT